MGKSMYKERKQKSQLEFIALMASLMAIVSLAMDALLPALGVIGEYIGITGVNNTQMLITMMFLGLGIGQLISGPMSDSFGRKPVIYGGFGLFLIASVISTTASSIEIMIIGRLLQGIGLSAPRTISMAIVRDSYSGNIMARIMSFVTVIFILVPAIAPAYGKMLLDNYGWKAIFYNQMIIAVIVAIWFAFRQKETHKIENRARFNGKMFVDGAKIFFGSKQALMYTIVLGFISGAFLTFLSTAQNILGIQYGLEEEFPYLFAVVAITVGVSTLMNGIFVIKIGMRRLVTIASVMFTLVSLSYVVLFYGKSNPSIYVLMGFFMVQFLSIGFLFGNLTALAMEPLGKIAGIGAAINGFIASVIAVPIAGYIGSFLIDSALPMFIGFFTAGLTATILLTYINRTSANKGIVNQKVSVVTVGK
jgi:DHA1 family bicyclomycin/chloramphenicol resistance-like MFS transporter